MICSKVKQYLFKSNNSNDLKCFIEVGVAKYKRISWKAVPKDILREAVGRLGLISHLYMDYKGKEKVKEEVMFPPDPPLNTTMWRLWYVKGSEPITFVDFVNKTPMEKFALERLRYKKLYKIQEYSVKVTNRDIISLKKKPRNEAIVNPELVK